jgi:WD40 repeat protein
LHGDAPVTVGSGGAAHEHPLAGSRVELVDAVRSRAALGDERLSLVERDVRTLERLSAATDDTSDAKLTHSHQAPRVAFRRARAVFANATVRTESLRRAAQAILAIVAVLAAGGAGYRYFAQGGEFLGESVVAIPGSGPVGMRPTLELHRYPRDKEVTVYLCVGATSEIGDCAQLGKGRAPARVRSKAIPKTFPDSSDVAPGRYVLRAGPDAQGRYPVRGAFTVERFTVGRLADTTRSFAEVDPALLEIGSEREIARGAACRPPTWLPDGRLAIGSTIVDPSSGVTIELPFQALEAVWSPDGTKLAYLTTDKKEIRIAKPDGSGAIAKAREARGLLSSLSWSPQSDRLAFISENDPNVARLGPGPPTVRILNNKTGKITAAGPGLAVAWSPRTDLLAVQRIGDQIEFSTPSGTRRAAGPGKRPAFTPDGRMLAYIRPGEAGKDEGWLAQLDGRFRSPVVAGGVCAFSVSPTGRELAVVKQQGTATRLVTRSVESK